MLSFAAKIVEYKIECLVEYEQQNLGVIKYSVSQAIINAVIDGCDPSASIAPIRTKLSDLLINEITTSDLSVRRLIDLKVNKVSIKGVEQVLAYAGCANYSGDRYLGFVAKQYNTTPELLASTAKQFVLQAVLRD